MAVQAFEGETKRPIKFTTGLDLDGQTLVVFAYDDQENETDITATVADSIGNPPNVETTVFIRIPDTLDKGIYNIKVKTDEVVASRDQMVVFGKDPFSYQ
jgi:hypothetical protein